MFDRETTDFARTIWDYLHMNHPLQPADVLLVLGSHDLRVPEYAAGLYARGLAPIVVVSGGVAHNDDLLRTGWNKTEAETFRDVLARAGVPADKILVENEARNTGENFVLSRRVLDAAGVVARSALVATKPYMERRAFATGARRWPDMRLIVTSPPGTFEEYFAAYSADPSPDDILNIMVGDLQRIDRYGRNGFQIPQEIPPQVWDAFRGLVERGYARHLVAEESV